MEERQIIPFIMRKILERQGIIQELKYICNIIVT